MESIDLPLKYELFLSRSIAWHKILLMVGSDDEKYQHMLDNLLSMVNWSLNGCVMECYPLHLGSISVINMTKL
jgi:hypothetical protein